MKTVLLDRNCNEINDGDFIEIYISKFIDFEHEQYYHKGVYKVCFDKILGLKLIFQSLINENEDFKNQYLSTTTFLINRDIILLHSNKTNLDIFDINRVIYYNIFIKQDHGVKFYYNDSYITKL